MVLASLLSALLLGCGDAGGPGSDPATAYAFHPHDLEALCVSHIVIPFGAVAKRSEADAQSLVAEVHERLRAGESFEALAERWSQQDTAKRGGFIGFINAAQDGSFVGAAGALVPGQTSLPVRTKSTYQIVRRHGFDEGRARTMKEEIPLYGFLVPYAPEGSPGRTKPEARTLALQCVEKLRAQPGSVAVVRDQAGLRRRGDSPTGFLRRVQRYQAKPALLEALDAVEEGQVGDPYDLGDAYLVFERVAPLMTFARHILIQHARSESASLRVKRTREQAAAAAQQALRELGGNPQNWRSVLGRYTDDDTVHSADGSLGLLRVGDMPRTVEDALRTVPEGGIADGIAESRFGFHIVWRVPYRAP